MKAGYKLRRKSRSAERLRTMADDDEMEVENQVADDSAHLTPLKRRVSIDPIVYYCLLLLFSHNRFRIARRVTVVRYLSVRRHIYANYKTMTTNR